ncbi:hydrogenobyrinate a,c-diamide synthase [Thalassotalea insulae]|uniref:Hydrogenobyrinate a,c-diamide synthase n=1 Tax=Thalassotalea insulae TaxID=2056778 RepID=A0ABQ6GUZ9_9GAMM|nr:cobyrinate a,c-diamide synthase [Thalassotalea insulae]GLX79763.1 hydrogenobyrinate a,c-diamide synthase [Thalassotalea insulae]
MTSAKHAFSLNNKPEHLPGTGVNCPALIIAAPHSGSGKTTITAALARYHKNQGKKVTVFKVGPDFIDPMILRQASGQLVYQLDLWLVGERGCQELLYQAAKESDLILIEGVMGLFDGTPSSADLARYFNIPVLGVIDAKAMAQTFAALAHGLAKFCPELPFAGVFANRVNSERHAELLQENLASDITFYGRLPKDNEVTLPERHLGLVQAQELSEIDAQLDLVASYINATKLTELPAAVEFFAVKQDEQISDITGALAGTRVIIIKDRAFSFIYAANIAFLQQAGAELVYCSALEDSHLPDGDVLYIPGGYPELYAQQLAENHTFISDVKAFAATNKPIIAECGGMLYLLDELTNFAGQQYSLLGLLPGKAVMQEKLTAIGSQWVVLPFGDNTGNNNSDNIIRGHSFHYSKAEVRLTPLSQTRHHPSERLGEFVYLHNNILASYMHWYLPSNAKLALSLFGNINTSSES